MSDQVGEVNGSVQAKINSNSEAVKESQQGKLAAATQVQSAEYLKPLFKLLRARVRHIHV